ncbi:MAG: hypothetical protein JWP52_4118 [Rhizobacter sp.]|nr:hypothetical protein [Rhizobacter sp.]
MFQTIRNGLGVAVAAMVLAGCAGLQAVDSEVSSYSQWPADRKPSTFAFERLPSQLARPAEQDQLESLARGAIQKAGFTPVATGDKPDVKVQIGARVTRSDPNPWDSPFWWGGYGGFGPRGHLGMGYGGLWGPGYGYYSSPPYYDREVAVLIRDASTGTALYETRARNDTAYNADGIWLAAMFDAAMKDFPQPAVSPRSVRIPLPQP